MAAKNSWIGRFRCKPIIYGWESPLPEEADHQAGITSGEEFGLRKGKILIKDFTVI
jgi:hypothetical protein